MKKEKKAIVLVYILFLVTITVIFATVLLSNNEYLFNISDVFETDSKLITNIDSDAKISIDLNRDLNSNWSWFIDNISCPSWTGVTMSWIVNTWSLSTTLVNSWSIYCEWYYLWDSVKLYFNTWFTDISLAEYKWFIVTLSWWLWVSPFWDTDSTLINFSSYNYHTPDWFDDNMNSDNYIVTSTWTTSTWTYYSSWYQDDDTLARRTLYWFVSLDFWFKKVFWNTSKSLKMIWDNSNNNDNINVKMWNVTSWYLYFDVDKNSGIKLVKFDKSRYNQTNELVIKESLSWSLLASIWYLQYNSGTLSLSGTITWNEYTFDFVNNDYAIFLKGTWTWTLLYNITGKTTTGSWIYINPINDSNKDYVKYLWNEIIIDSVWHYISKENELFFKK